MVNKTSISVFLFIIVFSYSVSADTTYVSGPWDGTWFEFASPYKVVGDIEVLSSTALKIMPGVEIVFGGHYKFNVYSNAIFKAIGEPGDSITFTALDTFLTDSSGGHHGLRFLHSANGCSLAYCRISYGNAFGASSDAYGGGVYCYYVSPAIINCNISYNRAEEGGGIYCNVSNPLIRRCRITHNLARIGGGIMCNESGPSIEINSITNNEAESGGGIECYYSSPRIWINEIAYNSAERMNGGGIDCVNSTPRITMNIIHSNIAKYGGGIRLMESNPQIDSNTVVFNSASFYGGGIHCDNSNPSIKKTYILENSAAYYAGGIYCRESSPTLINDIIAQNSGIIGGGVFAWDFSNPNIINCTIINNTADSLGGAIYSERDSDFRLFNSILWYNNAVIGDAIYANFYVTPCTLFAAYCDVDPAGCSVNEEGGTIIWGDGNIIETPRFRDDFYLDERSAGIDDGTEYVITPWFDTLYAPLKDIQGETRPFGENWDMGVDESPYFEIPENDRNVPGQFTLLAYPNPFNAEVVINFSIPYTSYVTLRIINMRGESIQTVEARIITAGNHNTFWKPSKEVSSGIYFCRFDTPVSQITQKILYLR
ncbi:T9SS type A sorting domain-containing protein [bacterium]|nr:T9SS type A sorting domain-containing protein [bacterium]